jgi:hypothetical protein
MGGMTMENRVLGVVRIGGGGRGCCHLPRKEDGGAGIMGKGGEGMDDEMQGGGGGSQNRGRGMMVMAMRNLVLSIAGVAVGEGDMFVASYHGKKMEEREQWAREEEEQTMRCKVEEEGRKIEGGVGWQWQWGTLCSALLGVAVGEEDMFVASSHRKKM